MTSSQDQPEQANDLAEAEPAQLPPLSRLEAVLFLASSPLPSRKLAHFAELEDGTQARTLVKQLNQNYDESGRSFHIKQIAGGYQLMTRPQFSTWLRRLEHVPAVIRLSNPAMETLSVIAYRQPVLKAEIEAVRGVSCGEMLRQLLERGLVKIAGRSEELGRPFFYATTSRFLETFGLSNLEALPRAAELQGRGLPDTVLTSQNVTEPLETSSENSQSLSEESKVNVDVSSLVTHQTADENYNDSIMLETDEDQTAVPVADGDEEEWDDDETDDDETDDDETDDDETDDDETDDDKTDDDKTDDDETDDDDEFEDGEWDDGDDDDDDDDENDDDDDELEDHWEEVDDDDDDEDDQDSDDEWDEDDDEDGDWEDDESEDDESEDDESEDDESEDDELEDDE